MEVMGVKIEMAVVNIAVEEARENTLALVSRQPVGVTLREAVGRICRRDGKNTRIAQAHFAS
jgi:hypothetical protein